MKSYYDIAGTALNYGVTLLLTLFPAPSPKVQALIESIREPEDAGPAAVIETAPEHQPRLPSRPPGDCAGAGTSPGVI